LEHAHLSDLVSIKAAQGDGADEVYRHMTSQTGHHGFFVSDANHVDQARDLLPYLQANVDRKRMGIHGLGIERAGTNFAIALQMLRKMKFTMVNTGTRTGQEDANLSMTERLNLLDEGELDHVFSTAAGAELGDAGGVSGGKAEKVRRIADWLAGKSTSEIHDDGGGQQQFAGEKFTMTVVDGPLGMAHWGSDDGGIVVTNVEPGHQTEAAGVRVGDKVLAVGGTEVCDLSSCKELKKAVAAARAAGVDPSDDDAVDVAQSDAMMEVVEVICTAAKNRPFQIEFGRGGSAV
jgi:hypothetical protein